jgi:hypothetical protein
VLGEQPRLGHAPGRVVRQAPGADASVGQERAEGVDDLGEGLFVVLDVRPVQVDGVDAEPFEAAAERPLDGLRREPLEIVGETAGPVRLGPDLGADRHRRPRVRAQPAADEALALPAEARGVLVEVVVVRGVEPAAAELDEAVEQREARALVEARAHVHGAESRPRGRRGESGCGCCDACHGHEPGCWSALQVKDRAPNPDHTQGREPRAARTGASKTALHGTFRVLGCRARPA